MKLDEKQLIIIAIAVGVVAAIMSCAAIGIALNREDKQEDGVTVFSYTVSSFEKKPYGNYYEAKVHLKCLGSGTVSVYGQKGEILDTFTVNGTGGYIIELHHPNDIPFTADYIIGIK